jgi:hypothetical protein
MDVFSSLSQQERENVTASAQEMIRKIHYRYRYNHISLLLSCILGSSVSDPDPLGCAFNWSPGSGCRRSKKS